MRHRRKERTEKGKGKCASDVAVVCVFGTFFPALDIYAYKYTESASFAWRAPSGGGAPNYGESVAGEVQTALALVDDEEKARNDHIRARTHARVVCPGENVNVLILLISAAAAERGRGSESWRTRRG